MSDNTQLEMAVSSLAKQLNDLRKQVRTQGRASQAANRSVETVDGTVSYYDADGNEVLTIGETVDGSFTITENNPTPPSQPSAPDVTSKPGAIAIAYDGTFVDGATPDDLAYFEIHRSQTPGFVASDATQIGTFSSPQGGIWVMASEYAAGSYYFAIQAVNRSGLESAKSDEVSGRGANYPAYTPITVPAATPTIEATGNASGIVLEAANVEPGTRIRYYGSTTSMSNGWVPSAADLIADTMAQVLVINRLPGASTDMLPNTQYFFTAIATNDVGDSPAGYAPEVSDTLHLDVVASETLSRLVVGFILAGKIQVGQAYIDSNEGIVIPQPDGGTISFPVNGDFAQITAHLIARSLNVTDNLTINGANNQIFGSITAAEGIVKPQVPPSLSGVTKPHKMFDVFGPNIHQGIIEDPASSANWLSPFAFFGTGVKIIRKVDYAFLGDMTIANIPASGTLNGFQPFGGMIYSPVSSRYIMLGTGGASAGGTAVSWWLVSFSRSGNTLTRVGQLEITAFATFPYQVRIGYDAATDTGYCFYMGPADKKFYYFSFTCVTTPVRSSGVVFFTGVQPGFVDIGGVYIGNADFGSKRFVIAQKNGNAYVFSGTPGSVAFSSNESWSRPATTMGLVWDGTRFWTLDTTGTLYKMSTNKAPAGRSTLPIQARTTWFDGVGTTHETDGGNIASFSLPQRQWLRVESAPAPDTDGDPGDPEKADQIRVYISSDGVTTPRLQTAEGWSTVTPNPTAWKPKVRTVTATNLISGDAIIYSNVVENFGPDDVGATVTHANLPAGTKITAITPGYNGSRVNLSAAATATVGASIVVTPSIATRTGLFEAINNAASAPPVINGFAAVGRAPGAWKSSRTDSAGPIINLLGDGSGRAGGNEWDNTGKMINTDPVTFLGASNYTTPAGAVATYPTGLAEGTFVAPKTGRVIVQLSAYTRNPNSQLTMVWPEIKTGAVIRSGTLIDGNSFNGVANANAQFVRGQGFSTVVGLTPGATYNVYVGVLATATAGGQINNTYLRVTPY